MQQVRTNFHTHTSYDHAQSTMQEMVEAAIAKGFTALGFSGHAYTFVEGDVGMQDTPAYIAEYRRLEQKYAGQLPLFMGIENDSIDPQPTHPYQYVIGSVHYAPYAGGLYSIDDTHAILEDALSGPFLGDAYKLCEAFYEETVRNAQDNKVDIVGHFDLVVKFNGDNTYFDQAHPRYRRAALAALDALLEKGLIIEVNTGGMARNYTKQPYPAPFLLRRILEKKGRILLSSDAHRAQDLDFAFDSTAAMLYAIGFRERAEFSKQGFIDVPLF